MSNETTSQPTSWSWGNTTEDYCLTGKVPMAEEANLCDWPYAPPFCEETWSEHVGESVFNVSKIVYICLFFPFLIIHIRMQYWSHLRQKIKKKAWMDKTSNEWLSFYLGLIVFFRILQELDYGCINGIWSPQWMYAMTTFMSGILICCLYSIAWGKYFIQEIMNSSPIEVQSPLKQRLILTLFLFLIFILFLQVGTRSYFRL